MEAKPVNVESTRRSMKMDSVIKYEISELHHTGWSRIKC
jgi:hypothetical protein